MTTYEAPDHSVLYLEADLSNDELIFVENAFWLQRWLRWWNKGWIWGLFVLSVPAVLLLMGMATLWVSRGFKAD